MTTPGLVCLATRRLDDPMPTIVQHMMVALSKMTRVLYVEPPVDAVFLVKRRKSQRHASPPRLLGPERLVPLVLPFENRVGSITALNRWLNTTQVKRRLSRWSSGQDVLWVPNPNFVWMTEKLERLPICYYVSDDYAHSPALLKHSSAEEIRARESHLLDMAKWVLVNSPALLLSRQQQARNVYWVPNGVDVDHYEGAYGRNLDVPMDLVGVEKPIAGFLGAVDGYKVDFELLEACARALRDVSFVTVGPIGWRKESQAATPPVGPNIYHLGIRPYDQLPAYLGTFDVAILPNHTKGYMAANFPMKLFEYFAAGLPVVATNLRSLDLFTPWVSVAGNEHEFIEGIRQALSGVNAMRTEQALEIAHNNTWSRQAARIMAILRGEQADPVIPGGSKKGRQTKLKATQTP